jgi:hypothetical protein
MVVKLTHTQSAKYGMNLFFSGLGLWCLMPFLTIFQLYHESVLLVEEARVSEENHRPAASH